MAELSDSMLKEQLGRYYRMYLEFSRDLIKSDKQKAEQLQNKNTELKKMNDRLRKQIEETTATSTKTFNNAIKEELKKELEAIAETGRVSTKVLVKKYEKTNEDLGRLEKLSLFLNQALSEQKQKCSSLEEELKHCSKNYDIEVEKVKTLTKGLHAAEYKCSRLSYANKDLRAILLQKKENEIQIEALEIRKGFATNLLGKLDTLKTQLEEASFEATSNLSKLDDMESKVTEIMGKSCVTCKKFHEKERTLGKITHELEDFRRKSEVLEAENVRLKEYLKQSHARKKERKGWMKNPFKKQ